MKKLLKLGAVLAALILALACFTACGGGSAGGGDDESGSYSGGNENTQTGGNESTQTEENDSQTGEEEEEDTAVVLTKEDVYLQLVAEGKMVETDGDSDYYYYDKDSEKHCLNLAEGVEEIETFVIDSKYTKIDYRAFSKLPIKSITIPAGITKIDDEAFFSCKKLESVTFAEGSQLEEIGEKAFYGCESLKEITIPAGITKIDDCAFVSCKKLESVTFAEGSQLEEIGGMAFYGCESLKEITIPASVKKLGSEALSDVDKATILATTPPEGFFEAVTTKDFTGNGGYYIRLRPDIYVPAESVDAYKDLCTIYKDRIKAIEE